MSDPAARVRLVVLDVDGTLTDGAMYYTAQGDHMKRFHTRDGMGIAMLQRAGLHVALVTGEDSPIVLRRGEKLKVPFVLLGVEDKATAVKDLCAKLGLGLHEVAYVGDDVNDLEVMGRVGLAFAVADAHERVRAAAHVVLQRRGGEGAVREAAERILAARREGAA